MGTTDGGTWILLLYFGAILGWLLYAEIPYFFRFVRRKNWPIAQATIQKGTLGQIRRGRNYFVPAWFFGYVFVIQGDRYAGFFVLTGEGGTLQKVSQNLAGAPLQIRYNPADANTSLIADFGDPCFEGLRVSQGPSWLDQAPAVDLQDAIRG